MPCDSQLCLFKFHLVLEVYFSNVKFTFNKMYFRNVLSVYSTKTSFGIFWSKSELLVVLFS